MPKKPAWYIEQRAHALALLLLTDAHAEVRTAPPDSGLSLIAELRHHEKPTAREFGVVLRGVLAPPDEAKFASLLDIPVESAPPGGFRYPVCGFVFDVKHNDGWWAWLVEPEVAEQGAPALVRAPHLRPGRLDREQVALLLAQVDRWYDALLAALNNRRSAG